MRTHPGEVVVSTAQMVYEGISYIVEEHMSYEDTGVMQQGDPVGTVTAIFGPYDLVWEV